MVKLFTKKYKNDVLKYGINFYQVNKEKLIKNTYFEKCREKEIDLKCNTCEYKEKCSLGEETFEKNPNIIEELVTEIIRCIESRSNKIKNLK